MNITLTLVGQTITFFLFVFFCKRFVWPALIAVMQEREKKIADGLEAAERAEKDLALAQKNAVEKMHQAKEQAAKIIDSAHKQSNQIIDEAKQQARAEANRLVVAANAEIQQQKDRIKEELRNEVTGLALVGAEKILASSIDAASHKAMVSKLVAGLQKDS